MKKGFAKHEAKEEELANLREARAREERNEDIKNIDGIENLTVQEKNEQ